MITEIKLVDNLQAKVLAVAKLWLELSALLWIELAPETEE